MLLITAIWLTAVLLGGLIALAFHLHQTDRPSSNAVRSEPPSWLAYGHGGLAVVGVGLFLYVAFTSSLPTLGYVSLGAICLAALGGITFFFMRLRRQRIPLAFLVGHGVLAAVGVVTLWITVLPLE